MPANWPTTITEIMNASSKGGPMPARGSASAARPKGDRPQAPEDDDADQADENARGEAPEPDGKPKPGAKPPAAEDVTLPAKPSKADKGARKAR